MDSILQSHATTMNYKPLTCLARKLEIVQVLILFKYTRERGWHLELFGTFHRVGLHVIPNNRVTGNDNLPNGRHATMSEYFEIANSRLSIRTRSESDRQTGQTGFFDFLTFFRHRRLRVHYDSSHAVAGHHYLVSPPHAIP